MKKGTEQLIPEARREGLVVQDLSGEVLIYDRERHKAHCLNQTAAMVWKHCDGKTPIAEMARAIGAEVNAPVNEDLVWLGVEQLNKSHLLRERTKLPEHNSGLSRREVMRRIGLAAAVTLPAVTSIIAPTAADAANCLPGGSPCCSSAQCCSSICSNTGGCPATPGTCSP